MGLGGDYGYNDSVAPLPPLKPATRLESILEVAGVGAVLAGIGALGAYCGSVGYEWWGDHSPYGLEHARGNWMFLGALAPFAAVFVGGWAIALTGAVIGEGSYQFRNFRERYRSRHQPQSSPSPKKD
jgi:hypothetical protein